jgi:hypothetical protein
VIQWKIPAKVTAGTSFRDPLSGNIINLSSRGPSNNDFQINGGGGLSTLAKSLLTTSDSPQSTIVPLSSSGDWYLFQNAFSISSADIFYRRRKMVQVVVPKSSFIVQSAEFEGNLVDSANNGLYVPSMSYYL